MIHSFLMIGQSNMAGRGNAAEVAPIENGCCYGVAKALLTQLADKVGYPFTVIPAEMFANGKEGYQASSLCGAMGGALGVIGLVSGLGIVFGWADAISVMKYNKPTFFAE